MPRPDKNYDSTPCTGQTRLRTLHTETVHANIAQTPSMDSTSQAIGGRRLS